MVINNADSEYFDFGKIRIIIILIPQKSKFTRKNFFLFYYVLSTWLKVSITQIPNFLVSSSIQIIILLIPWKTEIYRQKFFLYFKIYVYQPVNGYRWEDNEIFCFRSILNIINFVPPKTEFYKENIIFYFLIFYQPVYGYR